MLELITCVNNLLKTKTKYVQISISLKFWKEDEVDFYDCDENPTFTETLSWEKIVYEYVLINIVLLRPRATPMPNFN